ncbi:MAG: Txe/YoeB family addiction module toxin [Prevotellaceae bacterium]|jgi:toxin YoeB|nr:Txe/YoeB family addiction module toxin [Prevotellaceae bacterium]
MIYILQYSPEAEKDVKTLQKSGNKAIILKLRKLLIELSEHPTIGTGRPKPLGGNRAEQWSRRISDKHRLVYSIDDEKMIVVIMSAWGHYDDK